MIVEDLARHLPDRQCDSYMYASLGRLMEQ